MSGSALYPTGTLGCCPSLSAQSPSGTSLSTGSLLGKECEDEDDLPLTQPVYPMQFVYPRQARR